MSLSKIPLTFFGSPTFKPKGNENTPEKSLEAGIVNGAQSSKKRLRLDDFELPEIPHETGTVNSRQSLKVKLVFDDFELPGKSSIELLKFPTLPSVNSNRDKGSSKEEHPKTTTLLPKCG